VPPNQELPEGAAVGKARRVRSSTNAGSSGLSGGACLHADQARWQAAEEADDLAPAELTTDQNLSALVNAVDLKDVLGEIKTTCRDVPWSGSLSGAEAITLSHRALPGAGAVHPIIYGKVGTTLGSRYSAIVSPEPPNSAGTSLNFGKPSRMGSTVSA
jgi:hypothetical protein